MILFLCTATGAAQGHKEIGREEKKGGPLAAAPYGSEGK